MVAGAPVIFSVLLPQLAVYPSQTEAESLRRVSSEDT